MDKQIKCTKCNDTKSQHKKGFTSAGSQRWYCNVCTNKYTPEPKKWVYSEEEQKQAFRLLTDGNTARAVGRAMNMSKSNVLRWADIAAKKKL